MDQLVLIKQLNDISCIYHEKLKEMESKYSQLEKNDARFTFFHKCIQVHDNILFLYIIRKFYLPNKEFFNKHKDELTLREGLEEPFKAEHGDLFNNLNNEEGKKHAYFTIY